MTGIALAGHWVLDRIKFIDEWPKQAEHCSISRQTESNGGAPFNVMVDLHQLQVPFPTYGIGCIGDDLVGKKILHLCHERDLNVERIKVLPDTHSSYSDVFTVNSTAVRTIFHNSGANQFFCPDHVDIEFMTTRGLKIFYLGHLLLMEAMEEADPDYPHVCARMLHEIQQAGIETAVDIATETSHRYQQVVVPALPYIDHLIINELEAEKTSGITIRNQDESLNFEGVKQAAHWLIDHGVKKNVVIHMPEGSFWLTSEGKEEYYHPALTIPAEQFKASCGAGDAYCSGILVGLHEGWDQKKTMALATATAASSITSSHNSNGIGPIERMLQLSEEWATEEQTM
jgi:sugar/nucleoside kinase (ribokinase family)